MDWPSIIPIVIRSHRQRVTSIREANHTQDRIDSLRIEIRAGTVGASFVH